jgi:hypothetical protein
LKGWEILAMNNEEYDKLDYGFEYIEPDKEQLEQTKSNKTKKTRGGYNQRLIDGIKDLEF